MIQTTLLVALGGAIGASLRFLFGTAIVRLVGSGFPVAILTVNVVGSVLMGIAVVYFGRSGNSLGPFVMTGILGGFTTFSAFSLEAYTLFERGAVGQAALYVGLSVGLSIIGLVIGVTFARTLA
ncbi:MAG: fluoride efflux transporter CrcB [Pseudomonadota bacterium]